MLKNKTGFEQASLVIVLIAICIAAACISPVFLTATNIMNVLRQASLTLITSVGMVMILLSGEMDMSVGSTQGLVGVFSVMVLNRTGSVAAAVLFMIAMGLFLGLCNGLLVTAAKINSLIATLGTMAIFRGVAYVVTGGVSIQVSHPAFQPLGAGSILGVPVPLIIAAAIVAAAWFVLNQTVFGRYIYAIGGNVDAAMLAGVAVKRIKLICFLVSGVLASLSALILAARMNSGQPSAGDGFEFNVVSAVVLGGVSLNGGKGNLSGAVLGVLILALLTNVMTLMNLSSFYQQIARGVVILLAVYLDGRSRRSAERKLLQAKLG